MGDESEPIYSNEAVLRLQKEWIDSKNAGPGALYGGFPTAGIVFPDLGTIREVDYDDEYKFVVTVGGAGPSLSIEPDQTNADNLDLEKLYPHPFRAKGSGLLMTFTLSGLPGWRWPLPLPNGGSSNNPPVYPTSGPIALFNYGSARKIRRGSYTCEVPTSTTLRVLVGRRQRAGIHQYNLWAQNTASGVRIPLDPIIENEF